MRMVDDLSLSKWIWYEKILKIDEFPHWCSTRRPFTAIRCNVKTDGIKVKSSSFIIIKKKKDTKQNNKTIYDEMTKWRGMCSDCSLNAFMKSNVFKKIVFEIPFRFVYLFTIIVFYQYSCSNNNNKKKGGK